MTKVNINVNDHKFTADFNNSDTAKELLKRFPMKLKMLNLYSREMTYRFPESLPAKKRITSGYEVGDIAYWAPRHSFVIFYKQTDEIISDLQKIGRINSDISFFDGSGTVTINFSLGDR